MNYSSFFSVVSGKF